MRGSTAQPAIVGDRRVSGLGLWSVLTTLATLAILATFELGNDAWAFRPSSVEPRGIFAPLVRGADEEWSIGVVRTGPMLALLLVGLASAFALRVRAWPRSAVLALTGAVVALVIVPPLLLQVGLREATEPWFYTNDSTYQIELAGDLLLDGDNPYGHDYSRSGLERFYALDGLVSEEVRENQVVLHHFIYFPGTLLTAAVWRLVPHPFDDYRFLVLVATLGLGAAVFLFPAPFEWRVAIAAVVVANPLAVHAVWFGTADAVSLSLLVLAFAFLTRGRPVVGAATLGASVLVKQFALVAVPFYAAALVARRLPTRTKARAAGAFTAILLAGIAPFFFAGPHAFWEDTIEFGAGTHRIVGYGLPALLLRAGILDDREGPYPFALLALVLWVPLTAWLVWRQLRERVLWIGTAGFAISSFVLFFIGRAFHKSYLIWSLTAIALSALLARAEARRDAAASAPADPDDEDTSPPA